MNWHTWRCDTLIGDAQVLAGLWTRIAELIAVGADNARRFTFTPAQVIMQMCVKLETTGHKQDCDSLSASQDK